MADLNRVWAVLCNTNLSSPTSSPAPLLPTSNG